MSITLDLNEEIARQAEQYAQQQGRSLTALVEDYLRRVTAQSNAPEPLTPAVQELYGILNLPAGFDYKTQRDEQTL